ncbi:putative ammonium transporter 1 isoform X2 [Tachypleus tridentatus]|uniref:putative ammonium transporter 1 isoform X2 n=1 Tax=Tachypleus tridentatus TaxID=6853 RepID=UPI003FD0AF36
MLTMYKRHNLKKKRGGVLESNKQMRNFLSFTTGPLLWLRSGSDILPDFNLTANGDHSDFMNMSFQSLHSNFSQTNATPNQQLVDAVNCCFHSNLSTLSSTINYLKDNVDTMFLVIFGDIILFIAGIAYWTIGYGFAFGEGSSFIGFSNFASYDVEGTRLSHWFFQFVFAATAATIVSGSVAERCNFSAYLIYSFIITGFIYPVVAHWTWSTEGWLAAGNGSNGMKDFAGSGTVHLLGGTSAFIGAALLGPRIGKFDSITGSVNDIRGHSVPLTALGGFILLFGFLAFNGGSQGHITHQEDADVIARVVANTIIGGSFGGIINLTTYKLGAFGKPRQWSLLFSLNGALAGMVSTCAGCDEFYPWGAAVVGTVGGLLFFCIHVVIIGMKIDDPLDAVAVHFGGGLWGLIAAPLFRRHKGIVFESSTDALMGLAWNIAGMVAIIGWSALLSFIMFGLLKKFHMFRVDSETEIKGLDIIKHGEPAYPGPSWEEEQYSQRYHLPNTDGAKVNLPPNMSFNGESGRMVKTPTGINGRFRLISESTNLAFIPDTYSATHL